VSLRKVFKTSRKGDSGMISGHGGSWTNSQLSSERRVVGKTVGGRCPTPLSTLVGHLERACIRSIHRLKDKGMGLKDVLAMARPKRFGVRTVRTSLFSKENCRPVFVKGPLGPYTKRSHPQSDSHPFSRERSLVLFLKQTEKALASGLEAVFLLRGGVKVK